MCLHCCILNLITKHIGYWELASMTPKVNANLYGYVRKFSLSNSLIDSRRKC